MLAVLHLADFPLQAVLRLEPGLAGRAVALLDGDRRSAQIAACTDPARAAGVEFGQTAPQALARCPALVLRAPHAAAEEEAKAALLAAAFRVSPMVEETAPGVCTMQVDGLATERREPALCAAIAQLAELGLTATAGLAATPWLARCAAGRARPPDGPPRLGHAEAVCPEAGPCQESDTHVCVVRDSRAFLRTLPLAVVEPSPQLATIFADWGLRTLGDLTDLPKADIVQRLGLEGLAVWERAAGEADRPLQLTTRAPTFSATLEFEHEIETLEPLLFILRRFVDRLALELGNAGQAAGELKLELTLADETTYARGFRLPEPTTQAEILFRSLHTHLESLRTESSITAVRLVVQPVRPLQRQHGLFDNVLRDPHGFSETLARVVAIVGSGRVGTPVLENTHRPDAVTLVPPPAEVAAVAPESVHPPQGLALRRFRPPVPAKVELSGRAPSYVWTDGLRDAVCAAAGPWRNSGDWWDATCAWKREEWDVELEHGGVYRLLQLADGWFIEGEYD